MKTTFAKLAARLKSELDIEIINPKRNYPGHWQRSQGAWLWVANKQIDGKISPYDIGSTFSATYLIKHKGKLTLLRDGEIFPE